MKAFLADVATRATGKLRTFRNQGFRTRLRYEARAPIVLLSPHLDDAILDCWCVLTGPGAVRVVNVFAGCPRPSAVGYFERLAGASDSAAHQRRRIAEDRAALGRAGRSAANLDFLALAHRGGRPEPSFAQLDTAVSGHGCASKPRWPGCRSWPRGSAACRKRFVMATTRCCSRQAMRMRGRGPSRPPFSARRPQMHARDARSATSSDSRSSASWPPRRPSSRRPWA